MYATRRNLLLATMATISAITFVIVASIVLSSKPRFEFERCDQTNSELKSFEVSACPIGSGLDYCRIERPAELSFELEFIAGEKYGSQLAVIIEMDSGMRQEFDACALGLKCPLDGRELQHLRLETAIVSDTPASSGKGELQFHIYDLSDPTQVADLLCVKFPAQIV